MRACRHHTASALCQHPQLAAARSPARRRTRACTRLPICSNAASSVSSSSSSSLSDWKECSTCAHRRGRAQVQLHQVASQVQRARCCMAAFSWCTLQCCHCTCLDIARSTSTDHAAAMCIAGLHLPVGSRGAARWTAAHPRTAAAPAKCCPLLLCAGPAGWRCRAEARETECGCSSAPAVSGPCAATDLPGWQCCRAVQNCAVQ